MPEPYRYRLLFVGVNQSCGGPPLQSAVRDAEAMSERFRGWGYADPARNRLLVGPDATADRAIHEIRDAVAEPDLDLLLFYWAGAMQPRGRGHVLSIADCGNASALTLDVLTAALQVPTAGRQRVLILDTCATTVLDPAMEAGDGPTRLGRLSRLTAGPADTAVLAVNAPEALRREHHRRGYLTGALLEQLCPGSQPPRTDLHDAMRQAAESLTVRLHQQPFFAVSATAAPLVLPSLRPDLARRATVLSMPSRAASRPKGAVAKTA